MKKYLAKFDNEAAYGAFKESEDFVTPNVSWCVEEDKVRWNSIVPVPQHDYVEISGIKWATMNIGAEVVTNAGLLFQWGDIQGYLYPGESEKPFDWKNYKYGNGTSNPGTTGMTKYNSTDGLTKLQLSDDAANVAWGGNWRMPTSTEFKALGAAVTTAWTADYQGSGHPGMVCTDKTDNSKVLFFPTTGYFLNKSVVNPYGSGYYWSSLLNTATYARYMYFANGALDFGQAQARYYAYAVRAVLDE